MTQLAPFTLNPAIWTPYETQLTANTAFAGMSVYAVSFYQPATWQPEQQDISIGEPTIVTYYCVTDDFGNLILSRPVCKVISNLQAYFNFMAEARQNV